jgi:N-acyl-D-aspartate/D-glutamate deacylase
VVSINDSMPNAHRLQLKWIEEVNNQGIPVMGQAVTARIYFRFTFEDWNLFDDSPVWREATLGTVEEKKAKLADPRIRQALRDEYDEDGGTKFRDFIFGPLPTFTAAKVRRPDLKEKYEGLRLGQIAEREGKHPIDAMLDLTVADNLKTEWMNEPQNKNAEFQKEVMSSPYTIPGVSDGGAHIKFSSPGTYSTDMLAWLVRDAGVLSLEEAHFRLSALPAWTAQFKDRGTLREGMAADIMIYDLEKLKVLPIEVLEDLPTGEWRRVEKSEGYRWMMVNGHTILEDGKSTGVTPGRLLRHGRAA